MLALLATLALSASPEPAKVHIGIYVIDVRSVDLRAQSFSADLYLWLRYAAVDDAELAAKLEKVEPINGRFESREETDRKTIEGQTYVCWRIAGTFFFNADLAKYPFDEQVLPIRVESQTLDATEMAFADDGTGGSPEDAKAAKDGRVQLQVSEYKLKSVERVANTARYNTTFGDPERKVGLSTYSRYELRMVFEREAFGYLVKILLPLLIIIGMAWLVFFLPPDQLDTAAAVAMTALLSTMAYNVAVSQQMPEVGYLVLSDKFFIGTYVILFLTLAQTFLTFILQNRGKDALASKVDRYCRWGFPVLVFAMFGLVALGR